MWPLKIVTKSLQSSKNTKTCKIFESWGWNDGNLNFCCKKRQHTKMPRRVVFVCFIEHCVFSMHFWACDKIPREQWTWLSRKVRLWNLSLKIVFTLCNFDKPCCGKLTFVGSYPKLLIEVHQCGPQNQNSNFRCDINNPKNNRCVSSNLESETWPLIVNTLNALT